MLFHRKPKVPPKPPGKPKGRPGRGKGKRPWYLRPLRWIRYAVLLFAAASVAGVLFFRFVPVPCTPLMLIRLAERRSDGRPMGLDKAWRPLERISPRLQEAVVASEDQRFFLHHGFDWDAIGSAFTANGRGRRKLGASTISQQTAKNLFLWPDRTWLRKGLEAYFTVLIEALWPKRRILEVYLNIIETGDGMYGAEAAARRYFQAAAADLAAPQAALIAAALPNPRAWSPARPTGYLLRRRTWILRQMDHLPPMPWDQAPAARPLPAPAARPRPRGNAHDTSGPATAPGPGEPAAVPPEGSVPIPTAAPPSIPEPRPDAGGTGTGETGAGDGLPEPPSPAPESGTRVPEAPVVP